MTRPVRTSTTTDPQARAISKRGEELLDALETIILAEGFRQLSVSDIASRLSCSKRTLYELATSRNELVLRVLSRFFERLRRDADHASADADDPCQQVYDYLQVGVRAAERLRPAAVADIQDWAPARAIWQDHVAQRVAGLRRIIERGIAGGAFRGIQPAFVAEIVFAGINRVREPDFYAATDLTVSEAFDELYRLLLLALAPDAVLDTGRRARVASRSKRAQH